jgi:diguanylate cyclase (GGDEF)-like protein
MPISAVVSTESDPARARALDATVGMTRNRLPLLARLLEEPDALFMVPDVATSEAVPEDVARIIRTGAFLGLRLDRRASAEGDQGEFLGSLFVSFDRPRWLSPAELHTARALGTLATMAISNARLHEEALGRLARAERLATVDSLTQLANHRALQDALRHEFERARRHRRPLALALLDLDHFKRVNDTVGHEGGDAVLRDVAERLRGVARDGDLVARVGGEEFAWLMPDTDAIGAWEAAERAREAVAAGPVAGIDLLTLSAGVCDVAHAATPDDLYRLADGALYWAKARGRDATYRYSPDVVTALSADERAEQLERSQAVMSIRLLARVVDAKDPSTRRHSERVAELTIRLATALGWDQRRLVELHEAALVHDVGKIGVPDAVLFKPGRLTAEEYEVVKQHAALSAEMVADVLTDTQVAWVRSHHERWDGTGYPDGLEAREIPPGARIIALADAWDVMTGERPYSGPIPPGEALAEARRMRGRQFAPEVVDAMERLVASGVVGSAPRPAERASA